MNSMILFVRMNDSSLYEKFLKLYDAELNEFGQYVIERAEGWISLEPKEDVIEDYAPDELERIRDRAPDCRPYLLSWRNDCLCQKFLEKLGSFENFVFDNDHGLISNFQYIQGQTPEYWMRKATD